MFRLPKPVLSLGASGFALGILILAAPRAAHAIVATLVEVTNTASSRVPNKDVDTPGRHPYQQSCNSGGILVKNGVMSCQMPVVPPKTEIVIQNVSVDMILAPGPQEWGVLATTGGGQFGETEFPLASVAGRYLATQPTTLYADPGTQILCAAAVSATGYFECSVSGYTVSLR